MPKSSILEAKVLQDEAAAYAWVEDRIWPEGPVCPHCGGVDRISKMGGKSTRIGVYKCYQCRHQFSVKVGTVFEDSHVPMRLWLQAMLLLCSSKKGISTTSSTGLLASLSRPHGSCRIAFATLCGSLVLHLWAAMAGLWKSTKPSSVVSKAFRSREAARLTRTLCLPLSSVAALLAASISIAPDASTLQASCARTYARIRA